MAAIANGSFNGPIGASAADATAEGTISAITFYISAGVAASGGNGSGGGSHGGGGGGDAGGGSSAVSTDNAAARFRLGG